MRKEKTKINKEISSYFQREIGSEMKKIDEEL